MTSALTEPMHNAVSRHMIPPRSGVLLATEHFLGLWPSIGFFFSFSQQKEEANEKKVLRLAGFVKQPLVSKDLPRHIHLAVVG
jgi:hypothetical protein